MTGSEPSNEDIGLNGFASSMLGVDYLQHFRIEHSHAVDLNYVIVEKLLKLGGESEGFHLKFVGLLAEFSPEAL